MTFAVGGVDVTAVHVGPTAAVAVYAGSQLVWPTTPQTPHGYRFNVYKEIPDNPGEYYFASSRYRLNLVDADGRTINNPDGDHVVTFADGTHFMLQNRNFAAHPTYWLSTQHVPPEVTAYAAAHQTMDVYIDGPFYSPP